MFLHLVTYAIAANAVSNTIASFQVLPGMAIALGVTTVIARCVGAGDYEQVKYYTKKLMIITYLSMIVTNTIILFVLPWILKAYHLSKLTASTTTQIVGFYAICSVLIWPLGIYNTGCIRSGQQEMQGCVWVISVVSMWIFRIIFQLYSGTVFWNGCIWRPGLP